MSIIYINPYQFGSAYDPDAQDYINRVIAADVAAGDTNGLEVDVQDAINAFFVECKTYGIFNALKASCILAGARTLSGALVPLVSTMPAPTNYNFVAGDYNRKTGLNGDGVSKYLDTNNTPNNTPITGDQDNFHLAVYGSEALQNGTGYMGGPYLAGGRHLGTAANGNLAVRLHSDVQFVTPPGSGNINLFGYSRSDSSNISVRLKGQSVNVIKSSTTVSTANTDKVFFAISKYLSGRLQFYSLGADLDLALLDASVSTLMSNLTAAIP